MADSNITKRALASALRELMAEQPFEKINVGQICQRCNMNRKSFYYHFKDKYDLVNWIFDTEFIDAVNQTSWGNGWAFLEALCDYLYENRSFYRKALRIEGQNSFAEHFREMLLSIVDSELNSMLPNHDLQEVQLNFLIDGMTCAIERWLLSREPLPAAEFLRLIQDMIKRLAIKVCEELDTQS